MTRKQTTPAPAPKKKAKKPVQYYKVVDTKHGHHGFFYKVGLNEDPKARPLRDVGSCQEGALYFIKKEQIPYWLGYGDHIAWVTPASPIKRDDEKFKAHKLNITKMLPFKEAFQLLDMSLEEYRRAGIELTIDQVIADPRFDILDKLSYFEVYKTEAAVLKLVLANKQNKTLLKEVAAGNIEWSPSQVRTIIDNNITEIIGDNAVDWLVSRSSYKLLRELVSLDVRFLKMII